MIDARRRALLQLAGLTGLTGIAGLVGACRIEVGPPSSSSSASSSSSSSAAASTATPSGKVVLYTSIYPEVVTALDALVKQQLPGVELVVFQGGSEKVASRLDADFAAGRAGCDVLLVSDPFLSRRLKAEHKLRAHVSPFATPIDRRLVDVDNFFVAARASTMVVAFHTGHTAATDVPPTFAALLLADDAPAKDLALGDPLSSGTAFATVVALGHGDVSFVGRLRARGAAISGGNSVVLQKVLSGERRFGVVLLENVLAARARGEPVGFVVPADGAVVIPGDVVVLGDSNNPVAAGAFVDLLLSPAGQALMRGPTGNMHAADPRQPPPATDVPTLAALLDGRARDVDVEERVAADRKAVLAALEAALLATATATSTSSTTPPTTTHKAP